MTTTRVRTISTNPPPGGGAGPSGGHGAYDIVITGPTCAGRDDRVPVRSNRLRRTVKTTVTGIIDENEIAATAAVHPRRLFTVRLSRFHYFHTLCLPVSVSVRRRRRHIITFS